jgi:hypothetical protein
MDNAVQAQARRSEVVTSESPRRPERNRAVKDVASHDGVEIPGRALDIHDLQRDAQPGDRSRRVRGRRAGSKIVAKLDAKLGLDPNVHPTARPLAAILEKRARGEIANHRLIAGDGLHLGNRMADLPPDPSRAAGKLLPPLVE